MTDRPDPAALRAPRQEGELGSGYRGLMAARDEPIKRAPRGSARPWLCPEPRCHPLLNLRDGDYADITKPEPGQSFSCWGLMPEPVTFVYDGVEHPNDLNACHYTPLKGLIRWQENEADWNVFASYYRWAGDLVRQAKADREEARHAR